MAARGGSPINSLCFCTQHNTQDKREHKSAALAIESQLSPCMTSGKVTRSVL